MLESKAQAKRVVLEVGSSGRCLIDTRFLTPKGNNGANGTLKPYEAGLLWCYHVFW